LVNTSESVFETLAISKGCKVLRGGWPDFAIIGPDGSLFCVEVKDGSGLSATQKEMIQFLTLAGIPCFVSWKGEFPNLKKPKKLEIQEKYKRIIEKEYHHRLEIVEEKLQQIRKICDS
jgi:hypothetical protein